MDINTQSISFPFGHSDMQMRVAYTAAGDVEYIGRARPGALASAAEWQIAKITYNAARQPTFVGLASGTNSYSKVWDDRATYSYA
jgi:hypothetical protein